ncbi:MAG: beta/gamma crystallin-related protein [Gemmatimonas sp.]
MRSRLKITIISAGLILTTQAAAQVTFYEGEEFAGARFRVDTTIRNFHPLGFNDRAASAVVEQGRWEVCEDAEFRGRCTILSPGNYPSLAPMGFNRSISSARPIEGQAQYPVGAPPPPPPAPAYDYSRRPDEHLFEVPVHSVRVVVGPPEQRCWVERQQVVEPQQPAPNVPGAIIGGIIGGVLGHQVGGGRGQDVATGVGAVAGAAVGANVGRSPGGVYTQDVQRCASVPGSARPDYWDVMYYFDGLEHHMQLSAPPPPTVWVNRNGEPRM